MYKEIFFYTEHEKLQDEVSPWQCLQLEFSGDCHVRFVLHDNEDDEHLKSDYLNEKNIAFEINREKAIKLAKEILLYLDA